MKKILLYTTSGFVLLSAGSLQAACIPTQDCDELGYKYSYSQCGGKGLACLYDSGKYFCPETVSSCTYQYTKADCAAECKNVGSLTCSRNGTTYYASCGSSKCSYGQNCNNGVCKSKEPECNYYLTEEDCAKECKSVGSLSCQKNGKTYYSFCGVSKCSASQICNYNYGTCENKKEECTYTFTEEDCAKQCKNSGRKSCVRDGVIYYETCGSSYCEDGTICNSAGFCQSPAEDCTYTYTALDCRRQCKNPSSESCTKYHQTYYKSCASSYCTAGQSCVYGICEDNNSGGGDGSLSGIYFYCCDDVGYGCTNSYATCKQYTIHGDCSEQVPLHKTLGCSPDFQICVMEGPGYVARFYCP